MTNGNVRALMWKCVFNNVEMRVRWNEYTYLIMWKHIFGYGNTRFCLCQDTGTMNRPLRLTVCSLRISRIVRHIIGRLSAAVGADLSCPHIRIHPRNGERKCVCGGTKTRIWWFGYTYSIMWICIFVYVRIRARWIGPLRLTECSQPISWVFAT